MSFFSVLQRSKKSKARLGEITTSHGVIKTPAFVPVATKGTLKSLTPSQTQDIGVQVSFVNTYHLVTHPGTDIIENAGGIHEFSKLIYPLMSDSGGFQVFSLARGITQNLTQKDAENKRIANVHGDEQPMVVKIDEDGVTFRSTYDGKVIEFTPEKSMEYQRQIGADLIMAFDECTYYPATHEYAKKAMERTHVWLTRCVSQYQISNIKYQNESAKLKKHQYLYGIIQGGMFEDLRKESAKFVVEQDTPGVAIGGVSVGETKEEMREQVEWVSPYLPPDRPVHLLGVGHIDDILDAVVHGIDTFDCVEPTRLARVGILMQHVTCNMKQIGKSNEIDINKSVYKNNLEPIDELCHCYTCHNFTKSYLHHLFKQRELLGYTLATIHNLSVMESFMEEVRKQIEEGTI
ncbi:MAG: tRNA guanosine(34) transglycosylase Tgt [bacterium]|nr:tRNA guanosine(34) transglycosylase Tgt [bacterium]